RTSNGKGKIKNLKLEEVRSYDFGSWKNEAYKGEKIPTFEEFLCLVEELALEPYIEIKAGNKKQIQSLVETVSAHGLSNKVTWISFSSESLRFVIQKAPEARIGYLSSTLDNEAILTALSLRNGRNEVFLDARTIDDVSITKCQALGIPLELWTIDDEETIANLDSYISGVTSNKTIAKDHLFP
ncbi:MAG: hypothetical protein KBS81_11190, partial [Spirochaetales bacterium]|nr:hypothetical protein [Candidatus Physcosoma equi]